jgi:hypothetical protein
VKLVGETIAALSALIAGFTVAIWVVYLVGDWEAFKAMVGLYI